MIFFTCSKGVYYGRISQDKVVGGVNLTASIAGSILDPLNQTISEEDNIVPKRDDIVGLVEESSIRSKPHTLQGKVVGVNHHERNAISPTKKGSSNKDLDIMLCLLALAQNS